MTRKLFCIASLALLLVTCSVSAEQTRWLNVHVTEADSDTNVEVHLPLSLVLSVISGIKVEGFDAGKIDLEIDDADIDWPVVLKAVKDAPDGEFVRVKSEDADVNISKRENMMFIDVKEHEDENTEAQVTLPMSLIDALSFSESNQIDIVPLLESIAALPNGELVRVRSDDANVRIWIE